VPNSDKQKATKEAEPTKEVPVASPVSDDWVEVDKSSIPHKVTVEDADED